MSPGPAAQPILGDIAVDELLWRETLSPLPGLNRHRLPAPHPSHTDSSGGVSCGGPDVPPCTGVPWSSCLDCPHTLPLL